MTEILQNWRFYYTQDEGVVSRTTWWRAFFILATIFAVATIFCALLLTLRAPRNNPNNITWLTPLIYAYVIIYSVGLMIALASLYHLCAKRFTAQSQPKALAALFPSTVFLAGALVFIAPSLSDLLPSFVIWLGFLCAASVGVWQIYAAGFRKDVDNLPTTTERSS